MMISRQSFLARNTSILTCHKQRTDNLRNLLQPVFVNVIKSAISFAVNINDGNHVVAFEHGHYYL